VTPYGRRRYCVRSRQYGANSRCCKGVVYDRRRNVCCGGVRPFRAGYTGCCAVRTYNPRYTICCANKVTRRRIYGSRTRCCGYLLYRFYTDRYFTIKTLLLVSACCAVFMVTGRFTPRQFAPGRVLYGANSRCCKGVVYDRRRNVCCDGVRPFRAGYTGCCGVRTYNPRYTICCANKVTRRQPANSYLLT